MDGQFPVTFGVFSGTNFNLRRSSPKKINKKAKKDKPPISPLVRVELSSGCVTDRKVAHRKSVPGLACKRLFHNPKQERHSLPLIFPDFRPVMVYSNLAERSQTEIAKIGSGEELGQVDIKFLDRKSVPKLTQAIFEDPDLLSGFFKERVKHTFSKLGDLRSNKDNLFALLGEMSGGLKTDLNYHRLIKTVTSLITKTYFQNQFFVDLRKYIKDIPEFDQIKLKVVLNVVGFNRNLSDKNTDGASYLSDIDTKLIISEAILKKMGITTDIICDFKVAVFKFLDSPVKNMFMDIFDILYEMHPNVVQTDFEIRSNLMKDEIESAFFSTIVRTYADLGGNPAIM